MNGHFFVADSDECPSCLISYRIQRVGVHNQSDDCRPWRYVIKQTRHDPLFALVYFQLSSLPTSSCARSARFTTCARSSLPSPCRRTIKNCVLFWLSTPNDLVFWQALAMAFLSLCATRCGPSSSSFKEKTRPFPFRTDTQQKS